MNNEKILSKVQSQANYLYQLRDRLIIMNINYENNISYRLERYKLIGMLDILDVLGIDRTDFNWIF
jgi:hypothetical protein